MDLFHDDLRRLLPNNDGRKLMIRWTPGHVGIQGNEEADERAKAAARGENSACATLPKCLLTKQGTPKILPRSKSATMQQFKTMIKEEAKEVMRKSPRYPSLHSIDPSAPSNHFARMTETLPRRHRSLLFQLRSGHVPLNKYLHRIARSPTATCLQCNEGQESVHHFLITCQAYNRQRNALHAMAGSHALHVNHLLNDPKYIKPLFQYIARTRRFEQSFGNMSLTKDNNDASA